MARIKVDIRNFANQWRKMDPFKTDAINRGLESGVLRGLTLVIGKSPVDTGLYRSSWDTKKIADGHMQLGNSAPHAPVIEFGARPHKPPLRPLLEWAKRVLQDPSQPPDFSPEVWGLAIGTQKKIERVGQAPKRILTDSIPTIRKFIVDEIRKEIDERF